MIPSDVSVTLLPWRQIDDIDQHDANLQSGSNFTFGLCLFMYSCRQIIEINKNTKRNVWIVPI